MTMLNSLRSLQQRDFRIFWLAQILSLTGNWMQQVGQSWLVYRLTGSALMLGAVNVIALAPVLPISLLGGVVIDRVSRRRLLFVTQCGLALSAAGLGLVTHSGMVRVWHIIVTIFIMGAIGSVDLPARQAFVVDLVGKDDLMNATALTTAVFNLARVFGPALAGILVAWQGEAISFFLNALSFTPLAVGLLCMRPVRARTPTKTRSLAADFLQGLEYLLGQRVVLVLMSIMAVSSYTVLPYQVLMPVFAQDVLEMGPRGLGFLMAGVGAGATAGALLVANLSAGRRGRYLAAGIVLLPFSVIAFCLSRRFLLALISLVAVGAGTTWVQSMLNTLVQLNLQDHVRGRIMSLYLMFSVGMQGIGGLQASYLADIAGVRASLGLGAAVCAVYSLILLWRLPFLRRLP